MRRPTTRVVATLALVLTATGAEFASTSPASAFRFPECAASQIAVAAGHTQSRPLSRPASWGLSLTAVTFTNLGSTCHLAMGGPVMRFDFGSTGPAPSLALDKLSFPVGPAPNTLAPRLIHGAKQVVYLDVVPVTSQSAHQCHLSTANEFLVQGYAKGSGVGVHFVRRIPNVCFDRSRAPVVNYGVFWSQRFPAGGG